MKIEGIYIDEIFNKNKTITISKDKKRIDIVTRKKDNTVFGKTVLFNNERYKDKLEHVEELYKIKPNKKIIKSIDGKYFFVIKTKNNQENKNTMYYFNKDNIFLEIKPFYFNDIDWEGEEKEIPSIAHNGAVIHSIYKVNLSLYMKNPLYKEQSIYTYQEDEVVEIKSNIVFKLEDKDNIEDFLMDFRQKIEKEILKGE